jgi:hypothetical protein
MQPPAAGAPRGRLARKQATSDQALAALAQWMAAEAIAPAPAPDLAAPAR